MDPTTTRLEPLDATSSRREAQGDAVVVAAWTNHHEELYAFLVRTTRDREAAADLMSETFLRLTRETGARGPP
jgi:DNA-directed RNA polymerase specialized sigma24 family protein